ncbi:ImmA/IrrE family metallo-endopeptidase [Bordetella trematum]|uniref:ImmA/IrrE family metallo-endopeptidase n=1 Tax=Bordetella trematum TaxID=123899 RepID=UPI003AF35BA6
MSPANINEDDFPLTYSEESLPPQELYESFIECQDGINSIPKRNRDQDYYESLHRAFKENVRYKKNGQPLFRKRSDAEDSIAKFWLSRVREAAWFYSAWNDLPQFSGIEARYLENLARLSIDPGNIPNIAEQLAKVGIILIHERAIPGMKVDGACFLLETGHPVVALSLRYARLDIYWFTLLHELAHVVLHHERLTTPILDDVDDENASLIEAQANRLSSDSLISRSSWRSCNVKYDMSEKSLLEFANRVQVHPAIVAGRLQRDLNKHDIFTKIIHSEDTRKIIFGDE